MTDLILIAAILAMLALARGYVWACERLTSEPEPAPRARVPRDPGAGALAPLPLIASIGVADGAGLALALALLAYLVVTLLAPERFR